MKMYIECCLNKDKDGVYQVLTVDMGYREMKLFELPKHVIAELADVKTSDIYKMQEGDRFVLGELIVKPNTFEKKENKS